MDDQQTDRRTPLQDRLSPYLHAAQDYQAGGNSYKGLRIHALGGLHEYVAQVLRQNLAVGATIVDLASGTGALAQRCQDLGFRVTATDAVAENFRATEIPFVSVNLDTESWNIDGAPFEGVVAAEIIEHLENPRGFLRACHSILKPGGMAIVTTPNIESPVSKAMFCRLGRYQWFSESDYHKQGHITPMSSWQLRECAEEAGFRVTRLESFGDAFRAVRGWWKMHLLALLIQSIDTVPRSERGEILVAVLVKT